MDITQKGILILIKSAVTSQGCTLPDGFSLDDDSREYISGELKKLHLDRFYENMMKVIKNWFEDGESDDITEHITRFIFDSGNWGSAGTHALAREVQNSDTSEPEKMRTKMLLKDIFPPIERIKGEYPILEKLPIVLPFVWIWRLIRIVLFRRSSVRRSLKRASVLDKDAVRNFQHNLEAVGLEVNTKADLK